MAILAVDEDFIHFNKYISDLKLIKPRILS